MKSHAELVTPLGGGQWIGQRLDHARCSRVDVRANADLLAPNQRRA